MLNNRHGFTLIEITMVIALSATFSLLVIGFFGTMRDQAQFSASMEGLKSSILAERQEALATIKLNGTASAATVGQDTNNITIGRLLTFTVGSSIIKVDTLCAANSVSPTVVNTSSSAGTPCSSPSEATTIVIPWSATYAGSQNAMVAFVRRPSDGTLVTSADTKPFGDVTASLTYSTLVGGQSPVSLPISGSGRQGSLGIDPASSNITVSYQ
jgi:prepilin-type N-terminal cleavage/methylation domain-containing protein